MMMEVVHFSNVVTDGQMTRRPSISRFSQLWWLFFEGQGQKGPFLLGFKPLCECMCVKERERVTTQKRALPFMFFGKLDNFFCPNGFLRHFVCELQKKVIKAKVKDLNEPYVRTTLILTTFLWVVQIKGEVEGEENHFSKIIFAFFH